MHGRTQHLTFLFTCVRAQITRARIDSVKMTVSAEPIQLLVTLPDGISLGGLHSTTMEDRQTEDFKVPFCPRVLRPHPRARPRAHTHILQHGNYIRERQCYRMALAFLEKSVLLLRSLAGVAFGSCSADSDSGERGRAVPNPQSVKGQLVLGARSRR